MSRRARACVSGRVCQGVCARACGLTHTVPSGRLPTRPLAGAPQKKATSLMCTAWAQALPAAGSRVGPTKPRACVHVRVFVCVCVCVRVCVGVGG